MRRSKAKIATKSLLIALTAILLLSAIASIAIQPASAAVAGTIDIEEDWYKIGDSVKITVTDADLNVVKLATDEESATPPDGSATDFHIDHPILWPEKPASVRDIKASIYSILSVNPDFKIVTLTGPPPATVTLMAAKGVAAELSLDFQPYQPTQLSLKMSTAAVEDDTVIITGYVGGLADSETITFSAGDTEKTTTKIFDSVDPAGIDASGYSAGGTITIEADNKIFVTYSWSEKETVDVDVTSTIEVVAETVTLTETDYNTGVFEGTIVLTDISPAPDEELSVADGNTITAKYVDTDPAGTRIDTATVDASAPTATNHMPAKDSFIKDTTPVISVDILDPASGVVEETITMTVAEVPREPLVIDPILNGFHVEYSIGGVEALPEGPVEVIVSAEDVVGNSLPEEWSFTVDLTAPTLLSASATSRTNIEVTFDDNLDSQLDPETVQVADFLVDGEYPLDAEVSVFVVTLTVAEMPTDATPTVTLTGNGVADRAGNFLTEGEVIADDDIPPEVSVTVSPDPTTTLATSEVKTIFTLTFSETMNTAVQPTVKYYIDPGSPVEVTGAWISGTVWKAEHDEIPQTTHDGVNTISVSVATDIKANTMEEDTTNTFTIDTSVATPDFWPAHLATVYTDSPIVRITFDEVVNVTAATFDEVDVLANLTTRDNMTYRLATQDLEEGSHTIKVSAEDVLGNKITDASATFEVLVSVSIELSEGWNLFSLPLIPDDPDIEVILADVMDEVVVVWSYNASTTPGTWLRYLPAVPELSDLTEMEDGKGYWIEMTADATLVVYGTELPEPPTAPPVYHVYAGWNLIGFKSTGEMDVNKYLATIPSELQPHIVIYRWNALSQSYELVCVGWPGNDVKFYPGEGYWLYLTDEADIAPPLP